MYVMMDGCMSFTRCMPSVCSVSDAWGTNGTCMCRLTNPLALCVLRVVSKVYVMHLTISSV